jgi:hypothetical protein
MTVKQAKAIGGNVSTKNSKMGTTTYAIDAFACPTGSKLAKQDGTVCSKCYAIKLQKLRPAVDKGWKANLAKWNTAIATGTVPQWVEAIAFQINRYNTDGYHRWFDSGDLQSVEMLDAICKVAMLTPNIKHWLPTREVRIVSEYLKNNMIPDNLVIRVSSPLVNGHPLPHFTNTSTVHAKGVPAIGFACGAYNNGGKCGDCKACWTKTVRNVSYPKH